MRSSVQRLKTQPLHEVLNELMTCCGSRGDDVQQLSGRLDAGRLRLLVVGEAKRGKSTLVNALLGRPLLPTGVTPVTAISTTVTAGFPEHAEVYFADNTTKAIDLDDLAEFITEEHNPHNHRNVTRATVYVSTPLPAHHLDLVDTPGVGSVFDHNTQHAHVALETMDAAILVVSADPPISASEKLLLAQVNDLSVRTFVVLNKSDHLNRDEKIEAEKFTLDVLTDVLGHNPSLFVCSAREGLDARLNADAAAWVASGLAVLEATLVDYLERKLDVDLQQSIALSASRVANAALDECVVGQAAMDEMLSDRADQVDAFAKRLAQTRVHAHEAQGIVIAESTQMLNALDDEASEVTKRITREVSAALKKLVGRSRTSVAAELENQGRALLEDISAARIDIWLAEWVQRIDATIGDLVERQQQLLIHEFDALSQSARTTLHVELAATVVPVTVPALPSPHYQFGPGIGWNEPLRTAVRHSAPARISRKRSATYLQKICRDLVDRNTGRARAGLQMYVEESSRRLRGTIEDGYAYQVQGLEESVQRARELRTESSAAQTDGRNELVEREQALRRTLTVLGRWQSESSPIGDQKS